MINDATRLVGLWIIATATVVLALGVVLVLIARTRDA
jgi:hypothetical protein